MACAAVRSGVAVTALVRRMLSSRISCSKNDSGAFSESPHKPNLPDSALHIQPNGGRRTDTIGIHPHAVTILETFGTDVADPLGGGRRDAGILRQIHNRLPNATADLHVVI